MDIVSVLIGFVLGAACAGAALFSRLMSMERRNGELSALDQRFKASAGEALQQSITHFLELSQERWKAQHADSAHDLDKRQRAIDELIKPVHKNLEALNQALEQVKGTDQALRADVHMLHKETAKLVGALRDPSAQGVWGEFVLEGLLEKSGLIKGIHYETQVEMEGDKGRLRPDVVISLQDGLYIAVDAKAPINEFVQNLSTVLDESAQLQMMQNLARQVRGHVSKLGQKGYWENIESADFTVLFLPSEPLYSMALRADPTLVDFAAERNVVIASPTLLISLLRVVSLSWRQVEIAKNAQQISDLGAELYKSLMAFTGHLGRIGKNLSMAMGAYNDAVGSLERNVLPKGRKFEELNIAPPNKNLEILEPIDQNIRLLNEMSDLNEKKRA